MRLDQFMHEKGICESREKARRYIMAGQVYVDGVKAEKPSFAVQDGAQIEVRGEDEYKSRGGNKLEKALQVFSPPIEGGIFMDVGASTGGFTDCLLKNGAKKVYSIDVGYGQLAWSLRQDERVVVMERTNARYLTPQDIADVPDGAVMDVSFISIKKILPALRNILPPQGFIVSLIKPQFEAGRDSVGKNGVVKEASQHRSVLQGVADFAREMGFGILGIDFSPIKGPKGNIEFLMYLHMQQQGIDNVEERIAEVVDQAHRQL